jgi:hypothetical protein
MPAGSLIEPHARRECTASGLSLYFSRRHRQLAGHLAGRSVWRLRGQGCAYAAFKNIHFNPACAARWWPTLILPPKSALVQVTRAYAPAISALVRRREQALTYGNCVGPRTRAYCIHPYARTRTHWHSETLTSFSWLSRAHTLAPIQRFELAGARHGAGAAPQPQGALAAHSQGVPPSRF